MWSKRKKNRRFERGHILDVKVESRQLRAIRLRLAASVLARLLGTSVLLFLVWRGGDWALAELVFKNPAFAVQEIDIETDGILSKAKLRACAGVKVGDNLLALDLRRIRRDLEYMPWIRSAAVERVRPHTVRIRVIEREPIARTVLYQPQSIEGGPRDVVFFLDADGHVMLPLEGPRFEAAAFRFDTLPLLTGVAGADVRPGHRVESRQIQAALRFLTEFNQSPMFGVVDVTTVDLSVPPLLEISTGQGASIVLSVEDFERQLRRWRLVHDYAVRQGKALVFMDLSVTNNAPARWSDAAVMPPAAPKPQPSLYRKKHV